MTNQVPRTGASERDVRQMDAHAVTASVAVVERVGADDLARLTPCRRGTWVPCSRP